MVRRAGRREFSGAALMLIEEEGGAAVVETTVDLAEDQVLVGMTVLAHGVEFESSPRRTVLARRTGNEPDPVLLAALEAGCPPSVRPSMCSDCAYRPGSPEKSSDPEMAGSPESLEALALSGTPFWCHQGQRRVLRREHPDGVVLAVGPGAYDPPIVGSIPWQADGSPGQMCAGWDARRRALAAREHVPVHSSADLQP